MHDPAASLRTLLRQVEPVLGRGVWDLRADVAPLESMVAAESPVIAEAEPLERSGNRLIEQREATEIAAFADGIQRSRVIAHVDAVPVVYAAVAAVIRQRVGRRMETWRRPLVNRALFLPRAAVGDNLWRELGNTGVDLVDTGEEGVAFSHPLEHRTSALKQVSLAREKLERSLIADWVSSEDRWLLVDGGISGLRELVAEGASNRPAFGVIKSHSTLYGSQAMVAGALRLKEDHRSPLFLIRHRVRQPVVSWYLRVNESAHGDPLHGLLRLEVAAPSKTGSQSAVTRSSPDAAESAYYSELADCVSAWILAERSPLSLPDSRWDRLVYGVFDCERYLSAIVGTH